MGCEEGGSGRAGEAGEIGITVEGTYSPGAELGAHTAVREQFAGIS